MGSLGNWKLDSHFSTGVILSGLTSHPVEKPAENSPFPCERQGEIVDLENWPKIDIHINLL